MGTRERRPTMARTLILSLAIIAFAAGAAFPADSDHVITIDAANVLYRNAVEDARAGHVEEAISALRSLVKRFPERQDMLGDYAVVLGWAGDHTAALALLDKINRVSAPSYVIEGLANSARRLQRYDLAESLYRQAIARFPARVEPQIGLARTLADAGNSTTQAHLLSVCARSIRAASTSSKPSRTSRPPDAITSVRWLLIKPYSHRNRLIAPPCAAKSRPSRASAHRNWPSNSRIAIPACSHPMNVQQ